MARIEDYQANIQRGQEQAKSRIDELNVLLQAAVSEKETFESKISNIKEILASFVEKVKSNSVLYGLVKKLDVWQDIEELINDGGD